MERKTKIFIILFAALFLFGSGAFLLLKNAGGGTTAEIYSDGSLIETIDLNAVVTPYDIEVEFDGGHNTVHVEHGAISVSFADCPDKLCVKQGTIEDSAIPIVCLPHRLVIQVGESA